MSRSAPNRNEHFQTGAAEPDYRGMHRPTADGPPLHDLLDGEHFPDDVYSNLRHFTHMSGRTPIDRESIAAVRAARGKPDVPVTVYRAAPHGVTSINTGDWVTPSRSYAQQHAKQSDDTSADWPVHSAQVPARTVRNGGNDIIEWGYSGPSVPVKTHAAPKSGWPDVFEDFA